jgi:hypothetical protein
VSDSDRVGLGEELTDLDELLLRQVAPLALVEEGVPSSLAFMPRGSDAGCLSVDRGSCTTPEAAYRLALAPKPQGFALNTVGVWGISLREVREASLRAFSDPIAATEGSAPFSVAQRRPAEKASAAAQGPGARAGAALSGGLMWGARLACVLATARSFRSATWRHPWERPSG